MKVTVKLFASLRTGRFAVGIFDGEAARTVRDILAYLQIPEEEASIIFINNRHKDADAAVRDGDVLAIFPPVGGG
jgi:molybdopterin synthase sulfur carrier subunit